MKDKLIKIIDKLKYILEFIISIGLMINIRNILVANVNSEHIRYRYIILTAVLSILLLLYIIISIYRDRKNIEKLFLTFMIPIGMFYMVFVLPNYSYDEEEHVYRAYNVSKGIFVAETNEKGEAKTSVPNYLLENDRVHVATYKKLEEVLDSETNYNEEVQVFNSAQGYSPTLYIIPAIIFKIGRTLNINFTLALYIAKICNFVFFLIMGYYSIKFIPFGKLLMFVYLFNPMMIYQATSISADCIINAVTLFFIAYAIKIIKNENEMSKKDKIIIAVSAILVSLAKYIYFPLIFILLILLFKKNTTKKDKKFIITICIVGLILAAGWYLISSKYVDTRPHIQEVGVNSTEQIKYIIKHPFNYLGTLANTIYTNGEDTFNGFFGYRLGFAGAYSSMPAIFLYAILLISAIVFEKNDEEFGMLSKIIVLIDFIMIFVLIYTGLYLIWTGVGDKIIEGIQGRYFIPIIILPLLCCIRKNKYIDLKQKNINILYSVFLIIININAVIPIIQLALGKI